MGNSIIFKLSLVAPKIKSKSSSRQLLNRFFSLGRHQYRASQIPAEKEKKVEAATKDKEEHVTPKNIHLGTYETEIDAVYKAVKEK